MTVIKPLQPQYYIKKRRIRVPENFYILFEKSHKNSHFINSHALKIAYMKHILRGKRVKTEVNLTLNFQVSKRSNFDAPMNLFNDEDFINFCYIEKKASFFPVYQIIIY